MQSDDNERDDGQDLVAAFEARFPSIALDQQALALAIRRTGGGRNPFLDTD